MSTADIAAMVSAFAGALAASAACWNVRAFNKGNAKNRAVEILLRKESEWESAKFIAIRSRAANKLLNEVGTDKPVGLVLDFIDTVGYWTKNDLLPAEMVWHTFFYWFSNYYYACEDLIRTERDLDAAVWANIGTLIETLNHIQSRQDKKSVRPEDHQIKTFLASEQIETD